MAKRQLKTVTGDTFGEILERALWFRGWDSGDLAHSSGVSRNQIDQMIARVAKNPSLAKAGKLANALGYRLVVSGGEVRFESD
jgi:ribosome-binding protein aMBF1 (putative translation factor)